MHHALADEAGDGRDVDVLPDAVAEGRSGILADSDDDLAAITVPTTLVWGELDDSAPVAGARLAADLVPGARLEVVPGAGHLLTGELEARVTAALHDQLEQSR